MPSVGNLIEESWLATEILLIHMFKLRENTNLLATVGTGVSSGFGTFANRIKMFYDFLHLIRNFF